jgi:hypothetical protein
MRIVKADRGPLIHIHYDERLVHGQGVAIRVYGQLKIAAKEYVYAHELGLNTLKLLFLQPITGTHNAYFANTYVYSKGAWGNYASVDVFTHDGTEVTAGNGPEDGSLWLGFVALGE